jgi:hypothetical protein
MLLHMLHANIGLLRHLDPIAQRYQLSSGWFVVEKRVTDVMLYKPQVNFCKHLLLQYICVLSAHIATVTTHTVEVI